MSEDKPETYEEYREYLLVTLDYNFEIVVSEFIKLADKKIEDLARYAQMEHDEKIRLEERVKFLELQLKYYTEEQEVKYNPEARTDWSSVEVIARKIREERG